MLTSKSPTLNFTVPPSIVQGGLCIHGVKHSERFRMQNAWGLHAYHYRGALELNGTEYPFHAGSVSITPPDQEIVWYFPPQAPHYYVHFTLNRESERHLDADQIVYPLGDRFDAFSDRLRTLLVLERGHPHRARIELWSLLYEVLAPPEARYPETHYPPALQVALSLIRNSLSEKLSAEGLARKVGASPGHLNRIFREHLQTTPHRYITDLRIQRAKHLLRSSAMPIKSIAAATGFSDLQHFNKHIRKATGLSPRRYRERQRIDFPD